MSEGDFFTEEAKAAAAAAVKNVEEATSAEVVVAVRQRSGRYGVVAYHFGLGLAACVVVYLVLAPSVYSTAAIALDALLAFLLGTLLAANLDSLRRALSREATLADNTNGAARVAFFDLGISRTSGRNGILVYVSLFERRCVVLPDIGVDVPQLGPDWPSACEGLDRAVKRRDLTAFREALEALGPVLGGTYPRSHDDVNELADEVQ